MIGAILRLVSITLGTLFFAGLAVVFVRWAGQRQTFSPPAHAWFELGTWEFKKPEPEVVCSKTQKIPAEGITWLKVVLKDNTWKLDCDTAVDLVEKISSSPQKNWLIVVDSVDTPPLDELVKLLTPLDKTKSFAVYSASQRVARYLRKQSPQWLYAADAASLVRLHLFASFWIETILEFWPDFVIQYPDDKVTRLSTRESLELERRKKRVILLPSHL